MCRLVGLSDTVPHVMAGSNVVRCQPTALCVLPQQDRQPTLIREVFETLNKDVKFGEMTLSLPISPFLYSFSLALSHQLIQLKLRHTHTPTL
jgi:hypothetical protein